MTIAHDPQPLPPADLADRRPEFLTVDVGEAMTRIYRIGYGPIYFDKSAGGRFNAHDGSYGVMYGSKEPEGAFVETVLRNRRSLVIDAIDIETRGIASIRAVSQLKFLELSGATLSRIGCDADVCHRAAPYDASQAWSHAIYAAFPDTHGIAYRSRHDDQQVCYAVFERSQSTIEEIERWEPIETHPNFWAIVGKYDVALAT